MVSFTMEIPQFFIDKVFVAPAGRASSSAVVDSR